MNGYLFKAINSDLGQHVHEGFSEQDSTFSTISNIAIVITSLLNVSCQYRPNNSCSALKETIGKIDAIEYKMT